MICLTPRTERPRIAVLTMVSGEQEHLLSHVDGLAVSTWPPDVHVVTSIRDRAVTRGRLPIRSDRWDTVVPVLPVPRSRDAFCPGAHAAGQAALDAGAEVLIFLSVDVIPSRGLIQVLAEAAVEGQGSTPTLWHSTVDALGPAPQPGYPVAGDLDALFVGDGAAVGVQAVSSAPGWCYSFAMTAQDWRIVVPRVLDTHRFSASPTHVEDVITASSGQFRRVGGASAYLQHTPQPCDMQATG